MTSNPADLISVSSVFEDKNLNEGTFPTARKTRTSGFNKLNIVLKHGVFEIKKPPVSRFLGISANIACLSSKRCRKLKQGTTLNGPIGCSSSPSSPAQKIKTLTRLAWLSLQSDVDHCRCVITRYIATNLLHQSERCCARSTSKFKHTILLRQIRANSV